MRRRASGVSLAEAIIASFVLTAAMIVSASLYHTALNHSVRIDRRHLASRATAERIEEIRSWSRNEHGTNGTLEFTQGWGKFDGKDVTYPEYPGYTVHTKIDPHDLFSPSSAFEEISFSTLEDDTIPIPEDPDVPMEQRTLERSSYLVTVTASWSDNKRDEVVTRMLVTDPVRDQGWDNVSDPGDKAIELSYSTGGAPASLPKGASVRISATIKDAHGAKVLNPGVRWYVDPDSSGNGTVETRASDSTQVKFTNEVRVERVPGKPSSAMKVHTAGSVVLVARVRLGGIEVIKHTPPIRLLD